VSNAGPDHLRSTAADQFPYAELGAAAAAGAIRKDSPATVHF
jgi:hypothetical protein